MPLRIQNQEDVVFLQAQEMFPKIEAEVIHMVLSEFGFDRKKFMCTHFSR